MIFAIPSFLLLPMSFNLGVGESVDIGQKVK